jgi:hypothetical protein
MRVMRAALLTAVTAAMLASGRRASADDTVDPLEKWVGTPFIPTDGGLKLTR